MSAAANARVLPGFARAYWTTLRPYLFLVSGSTGLVGLAAAKDLSTPRLVVALVVFCVAYGLGQSLTDVTQTDTDALSAPYRPLVSGAISRFEVLALSGAALAACSVALLVLNPWAFVLALVSIAGLATYTPMKRRFWAGPLHNAWIVALLPAMGALAGGQALRIPLVAAMMASAFFSYATFVLLGYLKDVDADRATGYETLPVRYGRRVTVAVSAACVPLALVASAFAIAKSAAWGAGAVGWVVGALLLGVAHVRALSATKDALAHPAIATCVRGYVVLHLSEAVLLRPALCLPSLALYGAFELLLARRPCKEQV